MKKYAPVSVVIPCYNSSHTISRAIVSIENQTVLPQEVILVDDCSSQEYEIEYLKQVQNKSFLNIKLICLNKNVGPGVARNYGMLKSSFDYIAFLDSDDIWDRKKIEIQYNLMKDNGYFFTCHGTCDISKKNNVLNHNMCYITKINRIKMLFKNYVATRTVMIHKSLVSISIFNDKLRYSEDYYLWLEYLANGIDIYYIDDTLAYTFGNIFRKGLSSNLKNMYIGEIKTICRQKVVSSILIKFLLISWVTIKMFRRVILCFLKH
ncbi:MAG: glycosyltransferase family 2 protein [Acetivibrionales bacterium]